MSVATNIGREFFFLLLGKSFPQSSLFYKIFDKQYPKNELQLLAKVAKHCGHANQLGSQPNTI